METITDDRTYMVSIREVDFKTRMLEIGIQGDRPMIVSAGDYVLMPLEQYTKLIK